MRTQMHQSADVLHSKMIKQIRHTMMNQNCAILSWFLLMTKISYMSLAVIKRPTMTTVHMLRKTNGDVVESGISVGSKRCVVSEEKRKVGYFIEHCVAWKYDVKVYLFSFEFSATYL